MRADDVDGELPQNREVFRPIVFPGRARP
jgi:hypothetical protein